MNEALRMGRARPIRLQMIRRGAFLLFAAALLPGGQGALAHPGVEEALRYFDGRIEQSPRDQALYIQRGIVYSNDGQYEKARADFRRAAELGDPLLLSFELGVLEYRARDFAASRRHFDTCLQRFPDNTACLEYRARLARDAGDHDAAIADFRRLLGLESRSNPGTYVSLAELLAARDETGVAEALDVLDQANAKIGVTPQIQRHAIALELRLGRPEQAIGRMRALEPALGGSPDWKVEMAELLLAAGRRDEAGSFLHAAIEQLGALRSTPARQALMRRAQEQLEAAAGRPAG